MSACKFLFNSQSGSVLLGLLIHKQLKLYRKFRAMHGAVLVPLPTMYSHVCTIGCVMSPDTPPQIVLPAKICSHAIRF